MAARWACGPGLTTALAGAGEPETVCGHFRPQDSGRTSLHGGARGTARGWGGNAAARALQPREEHTAHPPLQTPAVSDSPAYGPGRRSGRLAGSMQGPNTGVGDVSTGGRWHRSRLPGEGLRTGTQTLRRQRLHGPYCAVSSTAQPGTDLRFTGNGGGQATGNEGHRGAQEWCHSGPRATPLLDMEHPPRRHHGGELAGPEARPLEDQQDHLGPTVSSPQSAVSLLKSWAS